MYHNNIHIMLLIFTVPVQEAPQRAAMAWDTSASAGFSDAAPLRWEATLPSDWKLVNYEVST